MDAIDIINSVVAIYAAIVATGAVVFSAMSAIVNYRKHRLALSISTGVFDVLGPGPGSHKKNQLAITITNTGGREAVVDKVFIKTSDDLMFMRGDNIPRRLAHGDVVHEVSDIPEYVLASNLEWIEVYDSLGNAYRPKEENIKAVNDKIDEIRGRK